MEEKIVEGFWTWNFVAFVLKNSKIMHFSFSNSVQVFSLAHI